MYARSSKPRSNRSGFVFYTAAVFFIVAIPVVGLAIDVSTFYLVQSKLQTAVDAASLAGVRSLARGLDGPAQQVAAQTTAQSYFHANFPNGYMGTSSPSLAPPQVDQGGANFRSVRIDASVTVPQLFLRWFGGDFSTVRAGAKATRRDVNVVIVLDRSGSLATAGACGAVKNAAQTFSDKFSEGRDNMGLVTFATSSRPDFPMASNFKTAPVPVRDIIGSVTCNAWTNSAQALWMGYQELARLSQPAAVNVILFFTDGNPTAVTANFPIAAGSTCVSRTDKTGVISESRTGLFQHIGMPQPIVSDTNVIADSVGCNFALTQVATNDIAAVPTMDFWGNSMNTGYRSVNLTAGGTVNPNDIEDAATNAADDAAARIRAATPPGNGFPAVPGVYIFGVGLGGANAASHDFMRRVTNDPASPIWSASSPTGLYVYAPSAADLNNAFNRVASEILRIAE